MATEGLEGQALLQDPSELLGGCVAPAQVRDVSDMADGV